MELLPKREPAPHDRERKRKANENWREIVNRTPMKNQNFNITLSVDKTPNEVFNAITNVRGWWSQEIEGGTAKLNDEFQYNYQDMHRCKMKLIEVVPDKKVTWLVLDNYFNFTQDKTEWKNTKINFEISR